MTYAAVPANQPHIDLGPEWSPEQAEARQIMERGLQSFLTVARQQPRDPFHPPPEAPLRSYQAAMQQLNWLQRPEEASELAYQAGMVGLMAERAQARRARLSRRPALAMGYVIVPGPDPGFTLLDMAWAGVPLRYHPRVRYRL